MIEALVITALGLVIAGMFLIRWLIQANEPKTFQEVGRTWIIMEEENK